MSQEFVEIVFFEYPMGQKFDGRKITHILKKGTGISISGSSYMIESFAEFSYVMGISCENLCTIHVM